MVASCIRRRHGCQRIISNYHSGSQIEANVCIIASRCLLYSTSLQLIININNWSFILIYGTIYYCIINQNHEYESIYADDWLTLFNQEYLQEEYITLRLRHQHEYKKMVSSPYLQPDFQAANLARRTNKLSCS